MSKQPIEHDDVDEIEGDDEDEVEHPAVSRWLDDEGDTSQFQKFQRGRRRNRPGDD
jgi:hypothetical protein